MDEGKRLTPEEALKIYNKEKNGKLKQCSEKRI